MYKDVTLSFDHTESNRFVLAFQQIAVTKLRANVTWVSHVGVIHTIYDLVVFRTFFQRVAEMEC